MVNCSDEIRQLLLGRKTIKSLHNVLKKKKTRRHHFTDKGPYSQGYDLSSSHVWIWELDQNRRQNIEELMLLNCDAGEDSRESLGQHGDQTSQSHRTSILNIYWKDWWWSWNSSTLAIWCKELTLWKRSFCWENWEQEEKGETEDETVGWHYRFNGHELGQTPEDGEKHGSLACCGPWVHKGLDMTWWLNTTTAITTYMYRRLEKLKAKEEEEAGWDGWVVSLT